MTYKALWSFGLFILEFFKTSRMKRDELMGLFSFEGLDELERAASARRGVILVTSHIGNWEAGALAVDCMRHRLHVVADVQFNRWLSPQVKAMKKDAGIGVVSPGPGEYRRLVEALRENEAIALVVDGDTFERGIDVPFLHGRLRAPTGPARLAAKTGASVISTHVIRERPLKFRMTFRTIWESEETGSARTRSPSEAPRRDGSDAAPELWRPSPSAPAALCALSAGDPGFVRDLTSAIMEDQERAIMSHLDQWCIFRSLWPVSRTRDRL
jgi:lauroyl/myristoyl acyltransferase